MPLNGSVHRRMVVDPVRHESLELTITVGEQLGNHGRILHMAVGQAGASNPAVVVHPDMQFLPSPTGLLAMLLAVPLTFSADLQSGAVDDEGDGYSRPGALWELDVERLVSPAEGAPG